MTMREKIGSRLPGTIHFFAAFFGECRPASHSRLPGLMDSQISLFHDMPDASAIGESLPPRQRTPMVAQSIVPWTPVRLMAAFAAWLMEETRVPASARTDA